MNKLMTGGIAMAMAITANAAELTPKENAIVDIGAWTALAFRDGAADEGAYRHRKGERRDGRAGGGQMLIVTAGEGFCQEWGKSARRLKKGDTVNIPANVKHWHGAAPNCWFQHVALEVPGTEQSNEWCEPVDDKAYAETVK